MILETSCDDSLKSHLPIRSYGESEWIPDLVPRPDGISFCRGILVSVALSSPIWVLVWLAVSGHF